MSDMDSVTRILLIDDEQVDRAMVRRALDHSGLNIELIEASNGMTGLRLSEEQTFDCILLDYRLPDIDAFDLLKALMASESGNHAVLMLTGEADQDIAFRLMRAGALNYLTKAETTPSSLARAIHHARARREFIFQLEAAQQEAEEKTRALDRLNKQKNLLFSIIAHDLRNPFQALLGLSDVLSRAVVGKDTESIARRAQGINQAAKQAHALMESLFAWASLQMDTVEVVNADVDLDEVARETLEGTAQVAADKGLSLKSDCAGLHVCAHRDMLFAVLRNLVSNAVKFTSSGGEITIRAWRRGGLVEVAVADTGLGMPPERVDELFRLDRRMTTEGTAGERGTGLGLLLCHDLVERQGGKLTVESSVGRGTTFRVTLPGSTIATDHDAEASNGVSVNELRPNTTVAVSTSAVNGVAHQLGLSTQSLQDQVACPDRVVRPQC